MLIFHSNSFQWCDNRNWYEYFNSTDITESTMDRPFWYDKTVLCDGRIKNALSQLYYQVISSFFFLFVNFFPFFLFSVHFFALSQIFSFFSNFSIFLQFFIAYHYSLKHWLQKNINPFPKLFTVHEKNKEYTKKHKKYWQVWVSNFGAQHQWQC